MSRPWLLVLLAGCGASPELARAPGAARVADAAVQLTGDQDGAALGSDVAGAGDVDGDGYADLLVGESGWDGAAIDAGRALLFRGGPDGLDPAPSWTFEGDQAGAALGTAVAGGGDVNADGYADVVVGAPGWDGGEADEGRILVFPGGPLGLAADPILAFEADQAGAGLGASVAIARDVDGDGDDEVLAGAPDFDAAFTDGGRAWMFPGDPAGPAAATWSADGEADDERHGAVVTGAGDLDADGYAEVAVGATGCCYPPVRVYPGGPGGLGATAAVTIVENGPADRDVAPAGDVDGDGYDDLLVGHPTVGFLDFGRFAVYRGSAAGLVADAPATILARLPETHLGAALAGAGDVNGDGYDDVVAGAWDDWIDDLPGYPYYGYVQGYPFVYGWPGGVEGRVYLYLGTAAGLSSIPAWTGRWGQFSARLGWSVAGAGDVGGDGYPDVAAGAPDFDASATDGGGVGLWAGGPAWYADGDGDGFGDPETWRADPAPGDVSNGADCDDGDALVSPLAQEICDPADADEDCDGATDDADASATGKTPFYTDADGDGHGTGDGVERCDPLDGQVALAGDCDDTRDDVHPGAFEICDAADADEDCDGLADDLDPIVWFGRPQAWPDADGDGYGAGKPVRACDPPPGYVQDTVLDCDDVRADVHPGATEVCDPYDTDEDCDGVSDEGQPPNATLYYADSDGDGYGDPTVGVALCDAPADFVRTDGDCAPADPAVHPGAPEACNGVDDDCDGAPEDPASCAPGDPLDVTGAGAGPDAPDRGDGAERNGCGCASAGEPGGGALVAVLLVLGARRPSRRVYPRAGRSSP